VCLFIVSLLAVMMPIKAENQIINEKVTPPIFGVPRSPYANQYNNTRIPYNTTLYAEMLLPGYYTPQKPASSEKTMLLRDAPSPVRVVAVCDDDMFSYMQSIYWWRFWQPVTWSEVFQWAGNIVEDGDDAYENEYQLDFQTPLFYSWTSAPGTLYQLREWGWGNYSQVLDYFGYEILAIFSGQSDPNYGGWGGGQCLIAGVYNSPIANLFQHEAGHIFYCPQHEPPNTPWCCMSIDHCYQTREWCSECNDVLIDSVHRFD